MKGNFNIKRIDEFDTHEQKLNDESTQLTESEFQEYIEKSGSAGSFMIFRSDENEESELGIDEI